MLFGSTLIRTLCAKKSVLFDTVQIVFVLAMGCFYGEVRGVHPINLKFIIQFPCSLPPFLLCSDVPFAELPVFPFVRSLLSSSEVSPTLHSDDRLEKAAHALPLLTFSSLHHLALLCTSPLFTLHFSFLPLSSL